MMLQKIEKPVSGAEGFALRMLATIQLYGEPWRTMRTEKACGIVFGLRMLGMRGAA